MKKIVVVGAGPAGASVAWLLAQRGMKVTLLEKETAFERVFRGEGLMPAGLDALHEMGLQDVYAQIPSRQLTSWDFYVGAQRRMRVVEPVENGLATQIMDQGSLLREIVQQAKQYSNFEFLSGWQVNELLEESGKIVGVSASCEREKRELFADCVLACDGRYSRLRTLAELSLTSSDPKNSQEGQFDVLWFKLPAQGLFENETPFIACLQPNNQFAFYPSWDGTLQIGWIVEKSDRKQNLAELKKRDWCELFASALPEKLALPFRAKKADLIGPIFLDVQVGCAAQWSIPGLLLLGDAAHPMAPNRAQGINMALRDAIVATNHLVSLQDAPITAGALAVIQHEREAEVRAVQKMQLAEWRKVSLLSTPGLPYSGFKTLLSLFGRFKPTQDFWLHEQKGLREGVVSVKLTV